MTSVSTATFTVVALRRDAGPARQVVLPYFDVALQGGSQRRRQAASARSVVNFAPGELHAWTRVQATVRVNRGAATLPANVRADPDPAAQGRRSRSGDRSAVRSGGARGGRQRDVRASGRLPADPGPAQLQRDPLGVRRSALTRARGAAKARRVTGGSLPEGRAGEFVRLGRRRRSNRPRNLSGTRDRARLTVWKVSASPRRGPPKGQSSQAQRQTGAVAEARRALAVAPDRGALDEQGSPQRSDRRDQARGTPFSGDPQAARAPSRAARQAAARRVAPRPGRADGPVRRL